MNKCGLNASRSDSGVISSSVSESALSISDSGSKKSFDQQNPPHLSSTPRLVGRSSDTPTEVIGKQNFIMA